MSDKEAAETVNESDFRAVFQWSAMPWALARVDSRIFDCNESFARVSGYTKSELLSFTIFNLIPTDDLQETFR
jgi:PAS domain S-box-containing protein